MTCSKLPPAMPTTRQPMILPICPTTWPTAPDAAEDKTKRAAEHAADVLAWDAIAEQLSPSGIPGDLLREALGPIQERLAQHAADTGWPQVRIHDDMRITGKRHPFEIEYDVGFDDDGLLAVSAGDHSPASPFNTSRAVTSSARTSALA